MEEIKSHSFIHSFIICVYNYITSCTTCKTTHIVYIYFMYQHTTILSRVQRVKQHISSTSVLCMSIQLYYPVYNVYNNTNRLRLFYVLAYNYITSCTTCRTTQIVYVCFMYWYTTILPRVQRVKQHRSSTSVLCISIQLYYLVYNV